MHKNVMSQQLMFTKSVYSEKLSVFSELWGTTRVNSSPGLLNWSLLTRKDTRNELGCHHSCCWLHQTVGWVPICQITGQIHQQFGECQFLSDHWSDPSTVEWVSICWISQYLSIEAYIIINVLCIVVWFYFNPAVGIIKTATELNVTLVSSACLALGEISRNMSLPLPPGEENDNEGEVTKLSILNLLLKLIKTSSQNNKVCSHITEIV